MTEEIAVGFWGRVGGRFKRITAFNVKLVNDWRAILKRSYAIRTAVFWSFLGGLVTILPLVSDEAKEWFGAKVYIGLFILLSVTVSVARVLKQPGTGDE